MNTHRHFMRDSRNYSQGRSAGLRVADFVECLARQLDMPLYAEIERGHEPSETRNIHLVADPEAADQGCV